MRDRSHLLWIVLPILPFLAGFVAMQILSDGTMTLLQGELGPDDLHERGLDPRFLNALLVFVAVGFFHVAGCIAVTVWAGSCIAELPPASRARSLTVLGLSLLALLAINLLARQPLLIGALTLSYRTTCALLVEANVAAHLLPPGCDAPGLSPLAWLATLPYLTGLLAAVTVSALVSTAFDDGDGTPGHAPDRRARLLAGAERIEHAFQATALILATGTLSMILFYRLPLPLIADDGLRELASGFGQGMAMFWGVLFTLTLMAVFGPAGLLLSRRAGEIPVPADGAVPGTTLTGRGARKRLADLLTMLAPLLVGSAGSALELLAGGL